MNYQKIRIRFTSLIFITKQDLEKHLIQSLYLKTLYIRVNGGAVFFTHSGNTYDSMADTTWTKWLFYKCDACE